MKFKIKDNVDHAGLSLPLQPSKVLISLKQEASLNLLNNNLLIALLLKEMKVAMEVLRFGPSSTLKKMD